MIPSVRPRGSTGIPSAATFWMPRPADMSEEGVGYFRDTWLVRGVKAGEARDLLSLERKLATAIGGLARTAEDFDRLARAVENGFGEQEPGAGLDLTDAERDVLAPFAGADEPAELESLELGVAGLVYALAAVRIIPAASCRGHPGDQRWSDAPVVLFAATEHRANALAPLVERSGCRFEIDDARPDLLVVRGRSILSTMALAEMVLNERAAFPRPRSEPATPGPASSQQEELF